MGKKLSIKHSAIAYILNEEMGYTQEEIARLMKVSQSAISSTIKDFRYRKQIHDLQQELDYAREYIQQKNLPPQNDKYIIEIGSSSLE